MIKKVVTTTRYICEKCNAEYKNEDLALACEVIPITQDKGVKVGDIVKVINGELSADGCCYAKVEKIWVIDNEWGHYAYRRYWHTIALLATFIGKCGGTRTLTFDSYEVIDEEIKNKLIIQYNLKHE